MVPGVFRVAVRELDQTDANLCFGLNVFQSGHPVRNLTTFEFISQHTRQRSRKRSRGVVLTYYLYFWAFRLTRIMNSRRNQYAISPFCHRRIIWNAEINSREAVPRKRRLPLLNTQYRGLCPAVLYTYSWEGQQFGTNWHELKTYPTTNLVKCQR